MRTQSNNINKVLKNWHPSYIGHETVYMPPGWKDLFPVPYTFVYSNIELKAEDYISFFRDCRKSDITNPRLFTPRTLQYASCFHPSFYHAVKRNDKHMDDLGLYMRRMSMLKMNAHVSPDLDYTSLRYWLQSTVFLSGVTLSAAIIQNRWSIGTLESKLTRLWQVAQYKEFPGMGFLKKLEIEAFVLRCASELNTNPSAVLKDLKLFYSLVLKELIKGTPAGRKELKKTKLSASQKERFDFTKELTTLLGRNVQCIIAYGSATNSEQFADYDLIIVVKNMEQALEKLSGSSPAYHQRELNISLFDETDFQYYQLASGDNLADHAICLYGSVAVPHKPETDLVARNYSFGYVRFRQLLGMAAHYANITSDSDDKLNLLNYFIKIPMNVFKGIQGCYEPIATNEEVKKWARETLDFDVTALQARAKEGFSMDSIAAAAWATQEVMHWFDKKHTIFYKQYAPVKEINHPQKISL